MGWIASVLKRLSIDGPVLFEVLVVASTIAGSLVLYRYYEYPFMQLGKRLAPGKKTAPVALESHPLAVPAGGRES
jgi:peptidoglycan/LPS O-acetylase OafA/YrhL